MNSRKVCLSKIWNLQQYLKKRQIQYRFNLKEKGNYKPHCNRKEQNKPTTRKYFQNDWPSFNWDNEVGNLNLDNLPMEDKKEAANVINEIAEYWYTFRFNVKKLKGRRIARNNVSKNPKNILSNIVDMQMICMSNATSGKRYTIMGQ